MLERDVNVRMFIYEVLTARNIGYMSWLVEKPLSEWCFIMHGWKELIGFAFNYGINGQARSR